MGQNAQLHALEFISASQGKVFFKAFVININGFDARFGDAFGAIRAARVRDCQTGPIGFKCGMDQAIDFGVERAAAVADTGFLSQFIQNDWWPIIGHGHMMIVHKQGRRHTSTQAG